MSEIKQVRHFPYRHCWANTELRMSGFLAEAMHASLCAEARTRSDNHETFFVEDRRGAWIFDHADSKGVFFTFSDGHCWVGSTARKGEYWDSEDQEWLEGETRVIVE